MYTGKESTFSIPVDGVFILKLKKITKKNQI